jgi:hypothetical protein
VQRTEEFLSLVLPSHGTRVLVEFTAAGKVHHVFDEGTSYAEMADDALMYDAAGHTVYMAMGGFAPQTITRFKGRSADNARWFKSLWIDIDAGPGKDYTTQKDAARALVEFVEVQSLPWPTLVDSGHGLHVYWPLDEEVPVAAWQIYAEKLKALAVRSGLHIDTSCTADAARILRPVGTHNYKFELTKAVGAWWPWPSCSNTSPRCLMWCCPAGRSTAIT